jgi:hypothetical protein
MNDRDAARAAYDGDHRDVCARRAPHLRSTVRRRDPPRPQDILTAGQEPVTLLASGAVAEETEEPAVVVSRVAAPSIAAR